MADKKKTPPAAGHEHTGGKVCKKCGRPTTARADGSLMHDRRGRTPTPPATAATTDPKAKADEEQEPELAPKREHLLMRRVGPKPKGDE